MCSRKGRIGASPDVMNNLFLRNENENLNELISFLNSFTDGIKGKRILEIGFGLGDKIPILVAEGIYRYHGIEQNEEAIPIENEETIGSKVVLECLNVLELSEELKYDVILMDKMIEYIPVFRMESVWKKIKKVLKPGGCIVLRTPLYKNVNSYDKHDHYSQINKKLCHKQSFSSILRTCLEQDFIVAKHQSNCFGIVKKADLQIFPDEQAKSFLFFHEEILKDNCLEMKDSYAEDELRRLMPGGGRMLIGCVTENFPPYREQALRLVKSIRWFGGSTAGVNIFVCVVQKADPEFVQELEEWGVFVRVVEPFNTPHKPSNKLRLFELEETQYYDTVMLLDCDTIMVQDPFPYIDGYYFQAEFASATSVRHNTFKEIFAHYKLELPSRKYRTSIYYQPTIWYCNAGVLIFPQHIPRLFFPIWKQYTIDLGQKKYLLGNSYFYCEQASLTLAYIKTGVPFKKLAINMNFPLYKFLINKLKKCDPVIIHYHKRVTKKGLLKNVSPSPFAKRRIRKFNEMLLEDLQSK